VARSASPLLASAVLAALLVLSGCADSTQRKNDRAELQARRRVAGREAQRVVRHSPDVQVTDVALVRDSRSTAIVVDLRSSAARPLTDLPVTVGVARAGGRRRALNTRPGLAWFQTHVPAIAAGGRATWVFRTRRGVRANGRPYATVGAPPRPPLSSAGSLPSIETSAAAVAGRTARARVENASGVPQSGLQVVAVERSGGRYVAAGRAALASLAPGASATVRVRLTGRPRGRAVRFLASPTIFE
jgi:hypothetical protein